MYCPNKKETLIFERLLKQEVVIMAQAFNLIKNVQETHVSQWLGEETQTCSPSYVGKHK
jgi:hypothetical protein